MSGGMVFEVREVHVADRDGWMISCAGCGGCFFNVTLGGRTGDAVVCANEDCGRSAMPAEIGAVSQPGR